MLRPRLHGKPDNREPTRDPWAVIRVDSHHGRMPGWVEVRLERRIHNAEWEGTESMALAMRSDAAPRVDEQYTAEWVSQLVLGRPGVQVVASP